MMSSNQQLPRGLGIALIIVAVLTFWYWGALWRVASDDDESFTEESVRAFSLDSCIITSEDSARRIKHPLWLHFPKCGSSFGSVLHSYGCTQGQLPGLSEEDTKQCICSDKGKWDPSLRPTINWDSQFCHPGVDLRAGLMLNHFTYKKEDTPNIVAMFRDPRRRLVSAYNDQKHCYGLSGKLFPGLKAITTLRDFVKYPGIAGCMTKMVLGHYCAADMELTQADLAEAKRILHGMAFVGITELWSESICLFTTMFGGKCCVCPRLTRGLFCADAKPC